MDAQKSPSQLPFIRACATLVQGEFAFLSLQDTIDGSMQTVLGDCECEFVSSVACDFGRLSPHQLSLHFARQLSGPDAMQVCPK